MEKHFLRMVRFIKDDIKMISHIIMVEIFLVQTKWEIIASDTKAKYY